MARDADGAATGEIRRLDGAAVEHLQAENHNPTSHQEPAPLIFADPASLALARLLARIGPSDMPVMITGGAGSGKGTVARRIHHSSGRPGTLLSVNCSALAAQTATREVEANGVQPGAANSDSEHWFEAARHGTLFLDEIADLPAAFQGQLLRQLRAQEAERLGSRDPPPAQVRLVAATSVDLGEAVAAGHFRLELFYRLNVGQVRLLPLRDRRGDIPALADHFMRIHSRRLNLPAPRLDRDAMNALTRHSWPGNVRELENVIRFALLVSPERELRVEHLKLPGAPAPPHAPDGAHIPAGQHQVTTDQTSPGTTESTPSDLRQLLAAIFQAPGHRLLDELEKEIVGGAFRFTGLNQVRTAALLGVSRNVLRTLLRKHALFDVRHRRSRGPIRTER